MTRVVPTLLYDTFGLVKGQRFDNSRRVGDIMQTAEVYMLRDVDELVLFDISAQEPDYELVSQLADICWVPLTVGGGVTSDEAVYRLLRAGADKVALCSVLDNHSLVRRLSAKYGASTLVGVVNHREGVTPDIPEGVGELFVQCIDRDGTMTGYDLGVLSEVAGKADIPVVASGGAGSADHMIEAVKAGASAVAAGAMWHFTHQTPREVKQALSEAGAPTRI